MLIKRENQVMHNITAQHLLNDIKCLPKGKKKCKTQKHLNHKRMVINVLTFSYMQNRFAKQFLRVLQFFLPQVT